MSFEPLINPIKDIDILDVDLVSIGGESGPEERLVNIERVKNIRDSYSNKRCLSFLSNG